MKVSSNLIDTDYTPIATDVVNNERVIKTSVVKTVLPTGAATITHTRPTVTNASSTILSSNTNRKNAGGFNQSGAVIYIKFGIAAVTGEGIRVANNESIIIPEGYTGDVRAIRVSGSGAVDIWEGT